MKENKILSITFYLAIISIFFTTIVYSNFQTNLRIDGDAVVRVNADIRISNLEVLSINNGAYETYSNKYSKNTTSMFATLPVNSDITYRVTVTNGCENDYILNNIIENVYDNSSVSYDILNFEVYDTITNNSVETFDIKLTNNSSSEQNISLGLEYDFVIEEITAPVIAGGSNQIVSAPVTISVVSMGTATSGVKNYEYYITNDENEIPTINTLATGTTSNEITVSNNDDNYIYYRTVSNAGNKSTWSNVQLVKFENIS